MAGEVHRAPQAAIPHQALHRAETAVVGRGPGSKVIHLDDIPELVSLHDGRRKRVVLNTTNTGRPLLVDAVTVAPGSGSPLHSHRGTDHFFVILEGRGYVSIEGTDYPLRPGHVVWVAEGDAHQIRAAPDTPLVFLEYFSAGDHETVFYGPSCAWQPRQP